MDTSSVVFSGYFKELIPRDTLRVATDLIDGGGWNKKLLGFLFNVSDGDAIPVIPLFTSMARD